MIAATEELKAWINDGYTRTAYFDATRMYPAVTITYRPMLVSNQAVIYDQISKQTDPRKRQEIAAAAIKAYVCDWSIDGISHENTGDILKIQPKLFTRIFDCISGEEGGDPHPDSNESIANSERLLEEALMGGRRDEGDIKN